MRLAEKDLAMLNGDYQATCPVLVGPIPNENTGHWGIDCEKSVPLTKTEGGGLGVWKSNDSRRG